MATASAALSFVRDDGGASRETDECHVQCRQEGDLMNTTSSLLSVATGAVTAGMLAAGVAVAPASAQTPGQTTQALMQNPLSQQVLNGCSSELAEFCANVTPGEGRLLACLFAYEDKLSGKCEFALYDAAVRLERAINTITYVATECRTELETHCGAVEVGEGRVAQCLKDHESELSQGCDQALTAVGLK